MPTFEQLAPYLTMLGAFFNSNALFILLLAFAFEVIAGAVRAALEDRFTMKDLFLGCFWKPVMYLSVFTMLKLAGTQIGLPLEWAVDAFLVKEIVSVLLNWKAITLVTNDPSGVVVDALIHFFSLDKFIKIPTK